MTFVVGIASSARLCTEVSGAGGLGVLDLGLGDRRAREELAAAVSAEHGGPIGVRVPAGCALTVDEFTEVLGEHAHRVKTLVLGRESPWALADLDDRYTIAVEVTSVREALAAVDVGADVVLARGSEADGRVSDLSAFVLLQDLMSQIRLTLPIWLCGGIGPNTATAAIVGGAAGVVLGTDLSARAVRSVFAAIEDGVLPPACAPLAPGSVLAQRFGTALPVAQGPMTRVSDQAGFAAAVAEAGALPFIALALANGDQTRFLLDEVKAMLGDKPWGVGVLGFAPEDVRAAQLEVIREVRPTTALIAGGRPDQARALEEVGISTFLHVPSPGLLTQFLAAGARKFVFEGSECGGHVGPRSSFSLWQAQLDVLRNFTHADELQLLFAGGVHDSRSAAMVSALAEPLAQRGAGVGVLMGTAYLFTREAVRHGAVQPVFQQQMLEARTTELLHTAPGHATRCVPSPFTDNFRTIGELLSSSGMPEREVWEQLEQLNVGRLRIASKGMRREGESLAPVDETVQLEEGLFMAGQVAVLRSEVTTISALHDEVTVGSTIYRMTRSLQLGGRRAEEAPPQPLDVAIIGMACMFPGAPDLSAFWSNVVAGKDSVTEVPADRWDTATYFAEGDGSRGTGDKTPSKWGGFLPAIPFDPLSYGIPPNTLAAIEPVQLLALEAAQRALADAGYGNGGFDRAMTSVVFGAEAGSDLSTATSLRMALPSYLAQVPAELDAQLPKLTEDSFPGRLANVIAGRIANRLDLGGANYTVDAACASSLAAMDVACKELVSGTSDIVLCGGADLHNAIDDYLLFSSVGALSATGRCRTFDSTADGIALGEGIACVVLKRLADAERDGDRIYAVVAGIGSGSDGKALGLTAPRPDGQRRALERAYHNADVSVARVEVVEAHGTGTVVGDRTELETLTAVFTESGATPGNCVLGSVKSQIGHTKCAAGLAGLIKSAMALHTGIKPPTLHVTEPNPAWQRETSPFTFPGIATPWVRAPAERYAGVSAFGFGGTNFHVVLRGHSSAEVTRQGLRKWPVELFTFTGSEQIERLLALAGTRSWSLRDLARTASNRSDRKQIQVALIAQDVDELESLLRAALAGETPRGLFRARAGKPGKLAVLFPGQGSQRTGMLRELFVAFPELRQFLTLGGEAAEAMFPTDTFGEHEERLRDTRLAQPALGVTGLAVDRLLARLEIEPDLFGGHSYGELVALSAAGSFDARTLLELSVTRAEAILGAVESDPGGMAAISAGRDEVEPLLIGQVVIANRNSPRQTVISGPEQDLRATVAALRDNGIAAKEIPVACAFHSPVIAGAGERFAKALAAQPIRTPDKPVWSNRTAAVYPDSVRDELAAQIESPVRFAEQIEGMYADGARIFLEAGPGRVLTKLVGDILGGRPHTVVSCDGGLRGFLSAVAQLAVAGVKLSTGWLFAGREARDVTSLPTPHRPGWTVDGHLVRTVDGDTVPGGLAPARVVSVSGTDGVINDFLRNSREIIAAQRDVILGYLGGTAPVVPTPPVIEAIPQPRTETDVLATVVGVIAERTGYPPEMIDPCMDLEADLSVDSIKRTEIAGELTMRLSLQDPTRIDGLVKARTARTMADLLSTGPNGEAPKRFLVDLVDATETPSEDPTSLLGKHIVLAGGPKELAEELAGQLSARGAIVTADGIPEHLDGLVVLHPVDPKEEFPLFQEALSRQPRWLLAVTPARVAGLRGFFRSLQREYPDTTTRLIEIAPAAPHDVIAAAVVEELLIPAGESVVVRTEHRRQGFRLVPTELGALAVGGPGPVEAAALGLDSESVIILIGGARGITAQFATTLAMASGCRVELVGRTTLPTGAENPETAAARDLPALRTALARLGHTEPAEIDRTAREILAQREVVATLRELRGHGSQARYHSVDVRDAEAIRQLVKEIHAEHGRIDGLVYAAGVIEDRLVADKDHESFNRVYRTKVDGATALLSVLSDLPGESRFVLFFGSIAAVLGSRGQTDYAAANDALEMLGEQWSARTGTPVLTVHWGPWAPSSGHAGMVSAELERSYQERGIALIHPDEGVASLLRELAWGSPTVRSVVYTAGKP